MLFLISFCPFNPRQSGSNCRIIALFIEYTRDHKVYPLTSVRQVILSIIIRKYESREI
jgi:hypothetical protein